LAARAGVILPVSQAGPLFGFVDQAGPISITGWARNEAEPDAPVCLDIFSGGLRIRRVLANQYREDLRLAGFGDGCHAFEIQLTVPANGPIEVRRASDGAVVPLTDIAVASIQAGQAWRERLSSPPNSATNSGRTLTDHARWYGVLKA
jgi:hypothetical protein